MNYTDAHDQADRLIAMKARRAAARSGLDPDDLAQEARIAVFHSLARFDPARSNLIQWIGLVADRRLGQVTRNARVPSNMPHAEVQHVDGSYHVEPVPPSPYDGDPAEGNLPDPEAVLIAFEDRADAKALRLRLFRALSPLQRRVVETYLRPPRALVALVYQATGGRDVKKRHVAEYLGISPRSVEWAFRRLRDEAAALGL